MAGRWDAAQASLSIVGVLVGVLLGTAVPAAAQLGLGGGTRQDQNAPIVFRADEVEYDQQLALTMSRSRKAGGSCSLIPSPTTSAATQ